MNKVDSKKLSKMLTDIENNFEELINSIIYYDSIDRDDLSFKIIDKMKSFPIEKKVRLLIDDLVKRNYTVTPNLLYNVLWYSIANSPKNSEVLINNLNISVYKKEVIYYLKTLNEGNGDEADLNIQKIVDSVE